MSARSSDEPDAPIVPAPGPHPGVPLGSAAGILLLPLSWSRIGVPAVVAAITAVCALLALVCRAPDRIRHPRSSRG